MNRLIKNAKLALNAAGIKNKLDLMLLWRYKKHLFTTIRLLKRSRSQFSQDVFVISELQLMNINQVGFFVEFGATDGISLSNSYLLEKDFGWNGILSEPAKTWHKSLQENRSCNLDLRCVTGASGEELTFNETLDGVYSTIDKYSNLDNHHQKRLDGRKYTVTSISLNNLLIEFSAPKTIDYLSIDTEGGEYEILKALNFSEWSIKIITVEHNFENKRAEIHKLLNSNGYRRVLENYTYVDDWYIKI